MSGRYEKLDVRRDGQSFPSGDQRRVANPDLIKTAFSTKFSSVPRHSSTSHVHRDLVCRASAFRPPRDVRICFEGDAAAGRAPFYTNPRCPPPHITSNVSPLRGRACLSDAHSPACPHPSCRQPSVATYSARAKCGSARASRPNFVCSPRPLLAASRACVSTAAIVRRVRFRFGTRSGLEVASPRPHARLRARSGSARASRPNFRSRYLSRAHVRRAAAIVFFHALRYGLVQPVCHDLRSR